jgi:hypothetical protein
MCIEGQCVCPTPDPAVRVADAEYGDDLTGNGSAACPVRSVTLALGLARLDPLVTQVLLRGGTSAAPYTYSSAMTGETFPLDPPAGVTVSGEGADRTVIRDPSGVTLLQLDEPGVTLEALWLVPGGHTAASYYGGTAIAVTAAATALRDVVIGDQQRPMYGGGIGVDIASGELDASGVTWQNLETGLQAHGSVDAGDVLVRLESCSFQGLNSYGIAAQGGAIATQRCTFTDIFQAIWLMAGSLVSNGDTSVGNDFGLNITGDVDVRLTGTADAPCRFENADRNIVIGTDQGAHLTMRGCSLTGSPGPSLAIVGEKVGGLVDLGTTDDPGGNVLQSASHPDQGGGICIYSGSQVQGVIPAVGNYFSTCPPVHSVSCGPGVDVGGERAQLTVDTSGCQVAP